MTMTIGQATAVNTIVKALASDGHIRTRERAIDALVDLVASASTKLGAGYRPREARILLEQHWPERADFSRYSAYLPGITDDCRSAIWCDSCPPGADPIWTDAEAAEQVTPISIANFIAICDEHEREHHGAESQA